VGGITALLGAEIPKNLEPLWRTVLKNEFHDILPGSGIAEVNAEARAELEEVIDSALAIKQSALKALTAQLPKGDLADALVHRQPLALHPSGPYRARRRHHPSHRRKVAPLGIAILDRAALKPAGEISVTANRLENAFISATIGDDGTVTSLIHKPTGREALSGRGNQLWVYTQDKPRNWDAWAIDEDYQNKAEEVLDIGQISVDVERFASRRHPRRKTFPQLHHHPGLFAHRQ
jgi:alpha-mannosidase